jgi:hypothetical protein
MCRDLRIGASGWTYDSWRGPFYPNDVPKKNWQACFASRFVTTEINGFLLPDTLGGAHLRVWLGRIDRQFLGPWRISVVDSFVRLLHRHVWDYRLAGKWRDLGIWRLGRGNTRRGGARRFGHVN